MKIIRRWTSEDVRNFCIEHGYYTKGNCAQYDAMLDMVRAEKSPSDDTVIAIAEDIVNHSNYEELCEIYGCDYNALVDNTVFGLFNEAITHHVVR